VGKNKWKIKEPGIFTGKLISLDEFVKIPAVYLNHKKYRWVKDLTVKSE
jgi:hypothetical protein